MKRGFRSTAGWLAFCAMLICGSQTVWGQGVPVPGSLDPQLTAAAAMAHEGDGDGGSFLDGVDASGFVNVGYSFNFRDSESSGGPETPGRVFDVFHNEFTVHQATLYLGKAATEDSPVGFSFVPMIGRDAPGTQDANLVFGGNDIDVLELNVKVRAPDDVAIIGGTTFTAGKFMTTVGLEVIDPTQNDNISRALIMGFAQPFVHTGIRADRTILTREDGDDLLTGTFAIVNGWGNHSVGSRVGTVTNGNFPTWLMSSTISPSDSFSTTLNYLVGETSQTGKYRNIFDIVASLKLAEDLTFSTNFDVVSDDVGHAATGGFATLWGVSGIVRYDFSLSSEEKNWYAAFRGEWFDDHDGYANGARTGLQILGLTWTLGYKPIENLLLRTEVRWDKADQNIYDNRFGSPRGQESGQVTLGFDASFLF